MKKRILIATLFLTMLVTLCPSYARAASQQYIWPTTTHALSRNFTEHSSKAIDISVPVGTEVVASREGTVYAEYRNCTNFSGGLGKKSCRSNGCQNKKLTPMYIRRDGVEIYCGDYCNNGFGNGVIIKHSDGSFESYAHMSTVEVKEGQYINQGQRLGTSGSSGFSGGPHLHIEIRSGDPFQGGILNPETLFNGGNPPPPINGQDNVVVTTGVADAVTDTSAILRGSFTTTGGRATECGMYLGTSEGNMTKLGSDKVNTRGTSMFYSTAKYGRTLEPGTTYYYKSYAVVNGTEFYGKVERFTTLPSSSTGISLDQSSITIPYGTCTKLIATTTPTGQRVKWTSSNPSVATVSDAGEINTIKAGTTQITAQMQYKGKSYSAGCSVTVEKSSVEAKVTLDRSSLTLNQGTCIPLYATTTPAGQSVVWESTNKAVATVRDGIVTAAGAGTATIKATIKYKGSSYSATCTVTVSGGIDLSVNSPTNIEKTTARVNGTCAYNGSRPSSVGLYLGTSASSLSYWSSDQINHNKNPFAIWYNLSGLSNGTTYYYQFYAVVAGQTYWSEIKSFTTKGPTSEVTVTAESASNIGQTTARVDGSCAYSDSRPSSVGLYLGTSASSLSYWSSDQINHNKNPFAIWYNLSGLSSGTTYYYQFYGIAAGQTYWSEIKSFTTQEEPTSELAVTAESASNIGQTTARVDGSCAYNGSRPSSVGLYLGTSASSLSYWSSDQINHNKNPFAIWYNLSGLSSGTTYYYQFYGIAAGQTYWSEIKSFTTETAPVVATNTRTAIVVNTNGQYLAINDLPAASPNYSNQIGRIPPAGRVTVYTDKASGNWYYVEYNGVSGYAYGKYLSLQ